jgi:hypothetical protein
MSAAGGNPEYAKTSDTTLENLRMSVRGNMVLP